MPFRWLLTVKLLQNCNNLCLLLRRSSLLNLSTILWQTIIMLILGMSVQWFSIITFSLSYKYIGGSLFAFSFCINFGKRSLYTQIKCVLISVAGIKYWKHVRTVMPWGATVIWTLWLWYSIFTVILFSYTAQPISFAFKGKIAKFSSD